MTIGPEDDLTTFPLYFDAEGRTLYMFDSRNRDTSALVAIDTETGDGRELAVDSRADVAGTMVHPVTRCPQAVAFEYDRVTWKVLDDRIAADIERITDDRKGQFSVTSCSVDESKWIIEYERDDGPKTYYLYKRESGEMEYLFSKPPGAGESRTRPNALRHCQFERRTRHRRLLHSAGRLDSRGR